MHARGFAAVGSANKPFVTEYKESYKDPMPVLGKLVRLNKALGSTLLEKRGRSHLMHDRACKAGAAAALSARVGKKGVADVVVKGMSGYKQGKQVVLPPLVKGPKGGSPPESQSSDHPKPPTVPAAPETTFGSAKKTSTESAEPPVQQYQTSLILPGMMQQSTNYTPSLVGVAPLASSSASAYTVQPAATGSQPGPPAPRVGYGENRPRYDIITGYRVYGDPYSGYKEGQRAVIETFQHMDAVANARSPYYNIITGSDALAPQPSRWPQTREVIEVQKVT